MLDLDGNGGKTFLRVLLHLGMHDYPPLVSGALHLLFRHFSQRQEVLQAFKQVTQINPFTLYKTVRHINHASFRDFKLQWLQLTMVLSIISGATSS